MERKAWITAARMVQKHGVTAVRVVESKLAQMQRDCADEDHFRRWCWVARAIFEIVREPYEAEAIH